MQPATGGQRRVIDIGRRVGHTVDIDALDIDFVGTIVGRLDH